MSSRYLPSGLPDQALASPPVRLGPLLRVDAARRGVAHRRSRRQEGRCIDYVFAFQPGHFRPASAAPFRVRPTLAFRAAPQFLERQRWRKPELDQRVRRIYRPAAAMETSQLNIKAVAAEIAQRIESAKAHPPFKNEEGTIRQA